MTTELSNASVSAVEEFWTNRVLGETAGIDDLGSLRFELLGALVLGWILVYFIIWKGLNESGYVSCILMPPYFHFTFNQS